MIAGGAVGLREPPPLADEWRLPVLLLSQYLFFLSRRPVSESNVHYLASRLEGLKTLAPVFAGSDHPVLERVVAQLGHLHPAAFRRLAPSLQFSLLPLARAARSLPPDVVVEDVPPGRLWLEGIRRALLLFGPGIGIGDELVCAPLPLWLKAEAPSLEVTTLSGYSSFWGRVNGVDRALQYSSHLEVLRALRGADPYDLVVFIDFEAPDLYRGVAADRRLRRYLEISLGARSAFLLDSERRWLHRLHHITPYFANYYRALGHLLRGLGLRPDSGDRFSGVVRAGTRKRADRLDVFVTPFTSKYDPSCAYWSRLLIGLVRGTGPFPVCLHLDSGKQSGTRRFAVELARSLAPAVPSNVEIEVARDPATSSLSLAGVYDRLERCRAVVCADSFTAHAGPLFDCLTLVLAKEDLKDWQVPSDASFYFRPDADIDELAAAMAGLVEETIRPRTALHRAAAFTVAEIDACASADELERTLRAGGEIGVAFAKSYRTFAACHRAVAANRRGRSGGVVFGDSFADDVRAPDPDDDPRTIAAMALHLRDQLERWQNTNFAKYVRRATSREAAPEERAAGPVTVSTPPQPRAAEGSELAAALLGGVRAILREQLPSGEVATFFRFGSGALEYRRSPLLSSLVHDALGGFDLRSRWVDTDFLDALPRGEQGRFVRAVALVRGRIRRFLLWEEESDGGWRFHGRGSGVEPDLDTTACAAAAVLEAPRRKPGPRWRAHTDSLIARDHAGLSARANRLRYLALVGDPTHELAAEMLAELRGCDLAAPGSRYAHPMSLPFCVARAWAQGALPGRDEVARLMVPFVLRGAGDDPAFGGPLGAALAMHALLDCEYAGPELIAGSRYLLESASARGGWGYGALLENDGGAPAFTTALAMAALARTGVGR